MELLQWVSRSDALQAVQKHGKNHHRSALLSSINSFQLSPDLERRGKYITSHLKSGLQLLRYTCWKRVGFSTCTWGFCWGRGCLVHTWTGRGFTQPLPAREPSSPTPGCLGLALHLAEVEHSAEGSSARFAWGLEALQQQSCHGQ